LPCTNGEVDNQHALDDGKDWVPPDPISIGMSLYHMHQNPLERGKAPKGHADHPDALEAEGIEGIDNPPGVAVVFVWRSWALAAPGLTGHVDPVAAIVVE